MTLKVFISHKQEDSVAAGIVAKTLQLNGISFYLDVVDTVLNKKEAGDLADHIRGKMQDCDQLMAVISNKTKDSWWVPWEIGVATEKNFLISTYAVESIVIPEYLKKWPYLKNSADLETYAKEVKSSKSTLNHMRVIKGSITQSDHGVISRNFYTNLKKALGQY